MKASIDNVGCMKIEAENHLEAYALGKWSDEYFQQETPKSTLVTCPNPLGVDLDYNVDLSPEFYKRLDKELKAMGVGQADRDFIAVEGPAW